MAMNGRVWETTHSGKMKGIKSISTSCATNPHCIKRQKDGCSVCSKCYANTYLKMRKGLKEHIEENSIILSQTVLDGREIPVMNDLVYRFESFGDIINATHLENYVIIAERNPYTVFALWTKNIWILDEVFNKKGIKRPGNMRIVVSSPLLNKPLELDRQKYWMVDHIFTVFDKECIKTHNIDINCGAKSCIGCQICYHNDTEFYVNEKLK